ncbi:MAG: Ldh family oxidoreductase [Anaerolineales bacterium]|nr:Ldh family oxidoreductase [Anaerolineales bacterium]
MIHIDSEQLTNLVQAIFIAAEATEANAVRVAKSLVAANLTGHDSHGVIRTVQYVAAIEAGRIDPQATAVVAEEMGAISKVDARGGFGQVGAEFAMQVSIAKAQTHGVAATTLHNSDHIGRVGEWVAMAAEQNLIGLAFCNGAGPGGLVTPYGGMERKLGTNPFAAAVPMNGRSPNGSSPFILDFATSVLAEGKVRVARNAGKTLAEGVILDKEGHPSTNPHDLYAGGMLLPAGLYKGYGLSLLIELLGGVLTGMGNPALPDYDRFYNGVLFIVLAIEPFRPLADFLLDAGRLAAAVSATQPAPGSSGVLLPGEPEEQTAVIRRRDGIPLDETTWGELTAVGQRLGIDMPNEL